VFRVFFCAAYDTRNEITLEQGLAAWFAARTVVRSVFGVELSGALGVFHGVLHSILAVCGPRPGSAQAAHARFSFGPGTLVGACGIGSFVL